jgi:hypothetical protein
MQSQADWQVVDSKKIHKEKSKKKAAAKGGNSDVMDQMGRPKDERDKDEMDASV